MGSRDQRYTAYVEATWARWFRTAYALTGDRHAAEDLLQATLAKVYVAWRRVERTDSPDAYVRRIMVNQLTSWRRSRLRRPEVLTSEPVEVPVASLDEAVLLGDVVWRMVLRLPARQRAVIVLRYYEDLTEHEIAHCLDIAPGTVKSQASAALATMRARLDVSATQQIGEHA